MTKRELLEIAAAMLLFVAPTLIATAHYFALPDARPAAEAPATPVGAQPGA